MIRRGQRRHVIYVAAQRGQWESYRVGLSSAISVPIGSFVQEALLHFSANVRDEAIENFESRQIFTLQELLHGLESQEHDAGSGLRAMGFPDSIARCLREAIDNIQQCVTKTTGKMY